MTRAKAWDSNIHETVELGEGAVHIGYGTRVWAFAYIGVGAIIGERCTIGQGVHVAPGVKIGNGCKIQNGAQLFTGVELEDDVFVGPHVVFTNVLTPRAAVSRKDAFKKTVVRRGVSIGANATIICGITIDEYAMIGAGSVVPSDVPAHALVYGNPAKQPQVGTRWACVCGELVHPWFKINTREIKACECGRAWAVGVNNLFAPADPSEVLSSMRPASWTKGVE